jgi:four helix bundle protein
MTYKRFEDLPVWQAAMGLARDVYRLTKQPPLRRNRSLCDQIQRAAVSVSNNIAEGFERGTTQELLTFLYIARGSAGEVRSMLGLFETLEEIADLKSKISDLKSLAESTSRQLRAWAESLQNSPITGQRYLTERVRQVEKTRTAREEFVAQSRAQHQVLLQRLQRARESEGRMTPDEA